MAPIRPASVSDPQHHCSPCPSLAGTESPAPDIRIQIISNPIYLSGTRELISSVAHRLNFPEEACAQLALAVDEALANVIRHGYGSVCQRPIWISLFPIHNSPNSHQPQSSWGNSSLPDALKIVIEDEARQVDPCSIKSRNLDDIRPGGLGVHIIKTVMDHVLYEPRESCGMRLTMIKFRQTANSHQPSRSAHLSADSGTTGKESLNA